METLRIKKTPLINPKSKEKGFTVRVVTNGRIGAEQISEEACENTTLHPDEELLANKLFIKKICKYLREGYIVELGEVGTLQPSCSSGWRATEDERGRRGSRQRLANARQRRRGTGLISGHGALACPVLAKT